MHGPLCCYFCYYHESKLFQTFKHAFASKETETEQNSRPHVKKVGDYHASQETTVAESRPHTKTVRDKHVTKQSTGEPESRPHIRSFENVHANKRSDAPEYDSVPRLKLGMMHSTTESKPMEWVVKKQSVFGHVSQLSNSYEFAVPKLKKSENMTAMKESDWSRDYCIKPKIRINKQKMANTETESARTERPRIKMSDKMSATKESDYIDHDAKRVQMFKERNIHGHAANSTVQKLIYRGKYNEEKAVEIVRGKN